MIGLLPVIYQYALVHHSSNYFAFSNIKDQNTDMHWVDLELLLWMLSWKLELVKSTNFSFFSYGLGIMSYMNHNFHKSEKEKDIQTNMSPKASCMQVLFTLSTALDLVIESYLWKNTPFLEKGCQSELLIHFWIQFCQCAEKIS